MVSMPYMENGSLAEKLQKGQNDDTWKATTIAGIVTGMKYLHTKELHHGNLTPNNILINKEGHPQIGDYLCHRLSKSQIITKNKEDDIIYVAPELINDPDGSSTQKADIYSFAVILYEILVGREIFSEQSKSLILNGKRPEIPNTIDPVINEIISKCWSAKPSERFEFSDIYNRLKSIDFAITKNVDVNVVKEYIDSVFDARKMTVNVRLWDGSLHQMEVCLDDLVYEIRQRIGEYANIPVDQVILGRNESPFFCCWSCGLNQKVSFEYALDKMDDKRSFLNDRIIDLVVRITAVADKYPTFKNKLSIRMFPTNETKNNVTSFYMKPGKVSDMIKKITQSNGNLWILKGCNLKVFFECNELKQDDSMFEKGIKHNSVIEVENNWNDFININENYICCNYDDPIEEVFIRYLIMTNKKPIYCWPYLCDENGKLIKLNGTLREAGINPKSKLFVDFNDTGKECEIDVDGSKGTMLLNQNCTLRMLKIYSMLITCRWEPIQYIHIGGFWSFDDDLTIENTPLITMSHVKMIVTYRSIF